jgi:hypothetical protein
MSPGIEWQRHDNHVAEPLATAPQARVSQLIEAEWAGVARSKCRSGDSQPALAALRPRSHHCGRAYFYQHHLLFVASEHISKQSFE